MAREIIQYSMFPTEHDFNSETFKAAVLNSKFEECLRIGVMTGLSRTQEKFQAGDNSMSVMSHCLHEDVYNAIKMNYLLKWQLIALLLHQVYLVMSVYSLSIKVMSLL